MMLSLFFFTRYVHIKLPLVCKVSDPKSLTSPCKKSKTLEKKKSSNKRNQKEIQGISFSDLQACFFPRSPPQNKEYLQNDQQAIRHSSVIFVAPYWRYRISCLKVQLAPLAQGADSEK